MVPMWNYLVDNYLVDLFAQRDTPGISLCENLALLPEVHDFHEGEFPFGV